MKKVPKRASKRSILKDLANMKPVSILEDANKKGAKKPRLAVLEDPPGSEDLATTKKESAVRKGPKEPKKAKAPKKKVEKPLIKGQMKMTSFFRI